MPRSLFLKNELLTLFLLLIPLFSTGCGQNNVWGKSTKELSEELARGDYRSLAQIDFSSDSVKPEEALGLGPGAPYYLSLIFDRLKNSTASKIMLELAWRRSPSPWREEAGFTLAGRYLEDKEYTKALETARALSAAPSVAQGPRAEEARRDAAEALYWSKADAEAIAELKALTAWDPELSLFRAVSSLRLKKPEAHDLIVNLFLDERASAVHVRAWLYLTPDAEAMALFSDQEKILLDAKYDFASGDWAKGVPLMETVVTAMDPARLGTSALVPELGAAYIAGGLSSRGAVFMAKLAPTLSGNAGLDAMEAAGKCYRRVQDYGRALDWFTSVLSRSTDAGRQDRVRWFILDILLRTGPRDLMARIGAESALWHDPDYFSDLLEDKVSTLVENRAWKDLIQLQAVLEKTGPAAVRARLAYILARGLQEKLISRVPGASGASQDRTAQDLLAVAKGADPNGYYGTLSSCLLGETPAAAAADPSGPSPSASAASPDPLVDGLVSFGLTEKAFSAVWARRQSLSDAAVAGWAVKLSDAGDSREAMNLMAHLKGRRVLSPVEMRLLYPRPYAQIVEELTTHSVFPERFVYGMVREESYFDPDIVSSAGAVGLSQLMPATAADTARSLKIDSPDLTDPRTNLTLGLRFLENLLGRVGNLPTALLAYNAGLSRTRTWERQGGGLPLDLQVEAVPYEESRTYVRKILVSTVMYAWLYEDQDPRITVKEFYPKLFD